MGTPGRSCRAPRDAFPTQHRCSPGAGVGLDTAVAFLSSPLLEKLFWWGHAQPIATGTDARG